MKNANLKEEARQQQERLEVKVKEGEDLRNELQVLYDKHYAEVQTLEQLFDLSHGIRVTEDLGGESG